jgi:hypothetical protein
MIEARRAQTTFADGLIAEEVSDLWEPWMRHSDAILEDVERVEIVCQALSKRCRKSKTRGRKGTPADVVLRLLALKHMFNWSYDELHREVRANLVYREFTRTGGGKVPDDKIPWDGWRGKPVVRLRRTDDQWAATPRRLRLLTLQLFELLTRTNHSQGNRRRRCGEGPTLLVLRLPPLRFLGGPPLVAVQFGDQRDHAGVAAGTSRSASLPL